MSIRPEDINPEDIIELDFGASGIYWEPGMPWPSGPLACHDDGGDADVVVVDGVPLVGSEEDIRVHALEYDLIFAEHTGVEDLAVSCTLCNTRLGWVAHILVAADGAPDGEIRVCRRAVANVLDEEGPGLAEAECRRQRPANRAGAIESAADDRPPGPPAPACHRIVGQLIHSERPAPLATDRVARCRV